MSDPFCTDPWFMKVIYRLGEGFAPPGGSGYFGQWAHHTQCVLHGQRRKIPISQWSCLLNDSPSICLILLSLAAINELSKLVSFF